MATLTATKPKRAANELDLTAADELGDEFVNTGSEVLVISNQSGSPVTLTVETGYQPDGLDVADREIVVPDGEFHLLGPWPPQWYNDAEGKVQLTYSNHASVTVGVITLYL